MANTPTVFNALENFDEASEAFDYISFLFQSENLFLNDAAISPGKRLCNIKGLKEKITNEFESQESRTLEQSLESIYPIIESVEKKYLLKIFRDMLCVSSGMLFDGEINKEEFLNLAFKEFGFLDLEYSKKNSFTNLKNVVPIDPQNLYQQFLRSENELTYDYFEPNDSLSIKREKIINGLFIGDLEAYKNVLRQKVKVVGKQLFKLLLFKELEKIEKNNELAILLLDLLSCPENMDCVSVEKDVKEQLENLISKNNLVSLLSEGQKQLYKTLKVIKSKLEKNDLQKLPEDDKDVLNLFLCLKSNPSNTTKALNAFNEIIEQKSLYSDEKINVLYSSVLMIENEIGKVLEDVRVSKNIVLWEKFENIISVKNKQLASLIKGVNSSVLNCCKNVYDSELTFVKELKLQKLKSKFKKTIKFSVIVFTLALFLFLLRVVFVYFFDISSVYKNKYLPRAENILKSVPYPGKLKDSLDPVRNEIKQRERLDYIKDLNSRYFKVLSLYLSPQLPESFVKDSVADILIPDDLKNKESILNSRSVLSNIASREEWGNRYELLIGVNVLTQLRAYGAIANFLLPSLSHHVIKDERGLPVKKGNLFQLYSPLQEREMLKKDLMERFGKIPYVDALSPAVYIDRYDDNYKNISVGTKLLQIKVNNVKLKTIWNYKKSKSKEQIRKLKDVLQAIAVVESRIKELRLKIKERHDYIVRHNTYRAQLE